MPTSFPACGTFVHLGRGGVGIGLFRGCAGGVGWLVVGLLLLMILPGDSLALVVFLLIVLT